MSSSLIVKSFAQAAEELGEHVNNIKSLFNEKIDEFDGEPLFYISGLRSDGFKVLLVGKNEREAALKNYSSIFSCHVWGFRTKDYNEQVDEFKFSQTPLELGIRSKTYDFASTYLLFVDRTKFPAQKLKALQL